MRQKLVLSARRKRQNQIRAGDFNNTLSITDRTSRYEIIKDIQA